MRENGGGERGRGQNEGGKGEKVERIRRGGMERDQVMGG